MQIYAKGYRGSHKFGHTWHINKETDCDLRICRPQLKVKLIFHQKISISSSFCTIHSGLFLIPLPGKIHQRF